MPISWIFWLLAAVCINQVAVAQTQNHISKNQTQAISKTANVRAIDLNHASIKELNKIKGLGKKRAKAIIQYRQQHGEFHSLNDLAQVKGFTEKRLKLFLTKNQGKITVLHLQKPQVQS